MRPRARTLAVTPGFFRAFDVSLLRGRALASMDRADAPRVAVVSEAFARRFFPGVDPIGRRIQLGDGSADSEWTSIVGVMPTLYAESMEDPWPPEVLTPFAQTSRGSTATIVMRGPSGIANADRLRSVVSAISPDVPLYAAATMTEAMARSEWPVQVFGTMFVIFGVVSLVLAAIGLYAVMAFSVSRRVREMGIRLALGATTGDVIALICRDGAVQVIAGMVIGFAAGGALVRLVRSLLFEVRPGDPTVFALVAVVLGVAAAIACIVPALGATRVDPVRALRAD
jgi:hypothetical protein